MNRSTLAEAVPPRAGVAARGATPSAMRQEVLKSRLDALYLRFGSTFLETDPISLPRSYGASEDREVVGFLTAALAYGRVPQIKTSAGRVAAVLGPRPAAFLRKADSRALRRALEGFAHRFNDGGDVALLLSFVAQMLRGPGSIERFFMEGYSARHDDVGPALSSFIRRTLGLDCAGFYRRGALPEKAGVRFLLPSPENGSTCKRMNLFLRWMVRPDDGVDFGIWRGVSPSKLVIPLDTHVSRIASYIGLTGRRTADWKMALEVTRALRRLDPDDPVRYDFALCRLGILDACPRRRQPVKCRPCDLRPVCVLR